MNDFVLTGVSNKSRSPNTPSVAPRETCPPSIALMRWPVTTMSSGSSRAGAASCAIAGAVSVVVVTMNAASADNLKAARSVTRFPL